MTTADRPSSVKLAWLLLLALVGAVACCVAVAAWPQVLILGSITITGRLFIATLGR